MHTIEVIELRPTARTDEPSMAGQPRKLTVDELLAARLSPTPEVGPVSLENIENAIVKGALGRRG